MAITSRFDVDRTHIVAAIVLASFVVFPLFNDSSFLTRILLFTFLWSGFAVAWTLFSGFTGYFSFGHSIFFGLGAFTSTILQVEFGVSPWFGLVIGGFVAAAVALVIGELILRRLSGIYFGLAMLAIPMAMIPVLRWLGYIEISVPFQPTAPLNMSYRSDANYYYLALALLVVTTGVAWWVKRSRIGSYLTAIRENEQSAQSLGIDTHRHKRRMFAVSAFLSGLYGTLFVQSNFIFTPEGTFGLNVIVYSVVFPIAGGVTTVFGPILAGLFLYPIASLLKSMFGSALPGIDNVVYGLVIIVMIQFTPDGLYPAVKSKIASWLSVRD